MENENDDKNFSYREAIIFHHEIASSVKFIGHIDFPTKLIAFIEIVFILLQKVF